MSETQSRPRITQVGTVIVPVSDQDRAIEFYTQTLGFELRTDTPYGDGDRWVDVAPSGADTTIALVPPPLATNRVLLPPRQAEIQSPHSW